MRTLKESILSSTDTGFEHKLKEIEAAFKYVLNEFTNGGDNQQNSEPLKYIWKVKSFYNYHRCLMQKKLWHPRFSKVGMKNLEIFYNTMLHYCKCDYEIDDNNYTYIETLGKNEKIDRLVYDLFTEYYENVIIE